MWLGFENHSDDVMARTSAAVACVSVSKEAALCFLIGTCLSIHARVLSIFIKLGWCSGIITVMDFDL